MPDENMEKILLTRREFGITAAGILITFTVAPQLALSDGGKLPGDLGKAPMLDAWILISPDGKVTIFTGKVELGQGILTALAQIAAEELDVPVSQVIMIAGATGLTPDEGYTTGSQSIEKSGIALRYACAEARKILIKEAALRLGTDPDHLKVENGNVSSADGRTLSFQDIAKNRLLHHKATAKTRPKPADEHRIVGKPVQRLEIPSKVTGAPVYVQDMRLPGMVFGRIVRPPGPHDRLKDVDDAAVKSMPGVVAVVRDGSFLGVVATREEQAIAARDALKNSAKWTFAADLPPQNEIHMWLRKQPAETNIISEKVSRQSAGARRISATYTKNYIAHASIGPSCAVAEFKDGNLHIWSHTQGVYPLRRDIAKVLKMRTAAISVMHTEGSGCYGHNGADDVALDAALLARAVPGRPVKLQWMRDDEFGWEPLGSAMTMDITARLAKNGHIVDWNYEIWSNTHGCRPGQDGGVNLVSAWLLSDPLHPSPVKAIPQPTGGADRNGIPLYEFPNQKIVRHLIKEMPLRTSALRSLGAYANVFAIESFMDELAAEANSDPVEFRLRHLKDPRAREIIQTAAEKASWSKRFKGDGVHGRGFGFAKYKNLSTYVACVADVQVDTKTGRIRVPSITAAVDSGQVINPKGLQMQIEGGIIQSMSWTLKERVTFDNEKVTCPDWFSYPVLRFPEVPKIKVHLVNRPDQQPLGSGEASMGPAAAAIANAVSNAIGKRIRDLPISLRQA